MVRIFLYRCILQVIHQDSPLISSQAEMVFASCAHEPHHNLKAHHELKAFVLNLGSAVGGPSGLPEMVPLTHLEFLHTYS